MLTIVASSSTVQVILILDLACVAPLQFAFFCMFAFTLGCLGSTFKFCSFFVLSLFHSGSFTPLSVSLFFLANCFQ